MKLRIARKMDTGGWRSRRNRKGEKRTWWLVYSDQQLEIAERKLRHRWAQHHPSHLNAHGERVRSLSEDWYAANRVQSRLQRQRCIKEMRR